MGFIGKPGGASVCVLDGFCVRLYPPRSRCQMELDVQPMHLEKALWSTKRRGSRGPWGEPSVPMQVRSP